MLDNLTQKVSTILGLSIITIFTGTAAGIIVLSSANLYSQQPLIITPFIQKGIHIIFPKPDTEISSPLVIKGYVNGGGWSGFEGQVGVVELLDDKNNHLALAILKATSDWTRSRVYFEANLDFNIANTKTGVLVFHNENPSDLEENKREFRLPIVFAE